MKDLTARNNLSTRHSEGGLSAWGGRLVVGFPHLKPHRSERFARRMWRRRGKGDWSSHALQAPGEVIK